MPGATRAMERPRIARQRGGENRTRHGVLSVLMLNYICWSMFEGFFVKYLTFLFHPLFVVGLLGA